MKKIKDKKARSAKKKVDCKIPFDKSRRKVDKRKKKINSRAKGKLGELEFVHFLKERGITARRGQQYEGSSDSPDVIAGDCMADIHVEVKRTEKGNPYLWIDQACTDADLCKIPVVAHRRNGRQWLAVLDMRDFINLMERIHVKEKIKGFAEILGEKMSENLSNLLEQGSGGSESRPAV